MESHDLKKKGGKWSEDLRQDLRNLSLQLILLLFIEVWSEMVSLEGWLSLLKMGNWYKMTQ